MNVEIKALRLQRGWSQEQLASISGVSVRTIQRLENGASASLDTRKALAAAMDLPLPQLDEATSQEPTSSERVSNEEVRQLQKRIRAQRRLYQQGLSYLGLIVLLAIINLLTSPEYLWFLWPALGWGIALAIQAMSYFGHLNLFNRDWEQRQLAKQLRKREATSTQDQTDAD
ncbi:2TM domain-containing protein [Balneatrix alpica]|uniref:2TM domain-containing protein n=1 Tax=Balneatrix alpica TaxID=75684 RepID=A0ABV5ZF82_9GAMM|nr:2TM domain-containing protein [Balneatrix alpica]